MTTCQWIKLFANKLFAVANDLSLIYESSSH